MRKHPAPFAPCCTVPAHSCRTSEWRRTKLISGFRRALTGQIGSPRPIQPGKWYQRLRGLTHKPCRTSERSRRGRTLNVRTTVAANKLCSAVLSLRRRSTTSPGPGISRPSAPFAAAEDCVDRSRCDWARNLADHVGDRRRCLWERVLRVEMTSWRGRANTRLAPELLPWGAQARIGSGRDPSLPTGAGGQADPTGRVHAGRTIRCRAIVGGRPCRNARALSRSISVSPSKLNTRVRFPSPAPKFSTAYKVVAATLRSTFGSGPRLDHEFLQVGLGDFERLNGAAVGLATSRSCLQTGNSGSAWRYRRIPSRAFARVRLFAFSTARSSGCLYDRLVALRFSVLVEIAPRSRPGCGRGHPRRSVGAGLAAAGPDQRVAGAVFRVEQVGVDRLGEGRIVELDREVVAAFVRALRSGGADWTKPLARVVSGAMRTALACTLSVTM